MYSMTHHAQLHVMHSKIFAVIDSMLLKCEFVLVICVVHLHQCNGFYEILLACTEMTKVEIPV